MRTLGMLVGIGTIAAIAMAMPGTAEAAGEYDKLVEMSKKELAATGGELKIALDWPESDALPVMEAFMKDYPFMKKIDYQRETGVGPFGRYLISLQQNDAPPYDIMHVASEFESEYWKTGAFLQPQFKYSDLNSSRPAGMPELSAQAIDPQGERYVSTTGNARGIIYNPEIVKGDDIPKTWADCYDAKWKGKVVVDARNKLQAFQYDPKERARHIEWLDKLKANEVVLVRGQGSIVGKIAAGEYPIACGMNYHTSYRNIERKNVTTIKFVFPESIPLELGTRLFVPKWSRTPATAQLFAFWAATGGQEALGKYAYRGFTWNEKAHKFQQSKGKYVSLCEAECATKWDQWNAEYQEKLGIPTVN